LIEATHDLPYIAEFALRRQWPMLSAADRERFVAAFERLSVMTYASRFKDVKPATFKSTAPAAAADSGGGEAQASQAPGMTGSIESRADVIRAIEAIIGYYSRHEPGSPIPLVLDRAKGWVNMDFLAILNDINPSGAEDAKRVLTRTATE
jgi:type VI secretion system protein ImpA